MLNLIKETILYVLTTLLTDSVPLAFGIIVASVLNVYINPEKLKEVLIKKKRVSILGSVAFGAFTPFCSCGTMAIIVSMLTTVLPWGAIMAFITSSPLMSPDLFVMLSGIIGVKFAIALTLSTIIIGMAAGYISFYMEKYTSFFDGQIRFINEEKLAETANKSCSCSSAIPEVEEPKMSCCSAGAVESNKVKSCCGSNSIEETCCTQSEVGFMEKYKLDELLKVIFNLGVKKILLYFSIFAAIGYLINRFVPASVIISLFGSDNMFSVPLAALIGVPLYVSDAGAIPLIKTLMDSGASSGAILAFMITGPGTSIGAIVGSLTIMKRKAVFFYVGILLLSAIMLGYLYNFLLFIGL